MSVSEWSLANELCRLTSEHSERDALLALGLIPSKDSAYNITTDAVWSQGGAETYIFRFWIATEPSITNGYIVKACISLDLGLGIDGVLQKWLRRRETLSQAGLDTPRLVFAGQGMIIEELIPWSLVEYIRNNVDAFPDLLSKLIIYSTSLVKLGFYPVDAFSDLRTRGHDVILVDFGADLGDSGVATAPNAIYAQLLGSLRRWDIKLEHSLETHIHTRFFEALEYLPEYDSSESLAGKE